MISLFVSFRLTSAVPGILIRIGFTLGIDSWHGLLALQALAAAVLVLVPAVAMGTIMPLVLTWTAAGKAPDKLVGQAYALNTVGAITGAILGGVQWLVLKTAMPLPLWWVVATSAGMSLGLALSTAFFGSETSGNDLLWRAGITGLSIGLAQWLVLQQVFPQSAIWIAVVGFGWVLGWFITRSVGVDLGPKWSVFGSTGAWAFQLLTGLALYSFFHRTQGMK